MKIPTSLFRLVQAWGLIVTASGFSIPALLSSRSSHKTQHAFAPATRMHGTTTTLERTAASVTLPFSKLPFPHAQKVEDIFRLLRTDRAAGLTSEEATRRLEQFGPNRLAEAPPPSLWKLIAQQFDDLLVKILLAAAFVSFLPVLVGSEGLGSGGLIGEVGRWLSGRGFQLAVDVSDVVEPLVILLILILNATVGVVQELSALQAVQVSSLFHCLSVCRCVCLCVCVCACGSGCVGFASDAAQHSRVSARRAVVDPPRRPAGARRCRQDADGRRRPR